MNENHHILHQCLSTQMQARRDFNQLCTEAVQQQVERGDVQATHLRNRRRHLARQILKRIPHASRLSSKRLLHAATIVLAIWGFGISMPTQAQAAPVFKHVMLDGFNVGAQAKPAFVDIDGDGDLDAFVGEDRGTVKFYRNNGINTAPVFVADAANNPLTGFDVGFKAAPSFADIDNDGDLDAFIGSSYGTVNFYRNTGTALTPVFAPIVGAANPFNGFNIGTVNITPAFVDIDGDGDLDAFVGEIFGTVKFYRNTGTVATPVFTPIAGIGNPLNGIAMFYAAPVFSDIDNDGDLDAFIGSSSGIVKFYRNTGTSISPAFVYDATGNPLSSVYSRYARLAPTLADIDNDGDFDVFIGEGDGSVNFYQNTGTATAATFVSGNPLSGFYADRQPASSFADIDNDGDLDAFLGKDSGTVKFYPNTGTAAAPVFAAVAGAANPLSGVAVYSYAAPTFADIDGDGDLDVFVGEYYGTVKFYQNTGTAAAPAFTAVAGAGNPLNGVAVGYYAAPRFADIDGDGDLDAFVGETRGTVKFYRNNGTNTAPIFVADAPNNPLAGFVGSDAKPAFVDIDGDGDLDAFVGTNRGTVKLYRNNGTNTAPAFVADAANNPLAGFDVGAYSSPSFADIDNDGDLDVFVGRRGGTVKFFENFDPSPVTVADAVATTAALPVTTPDVTANDTFKTEGPAANFTITAFSQGTNGVVVQVAGTNTFTYTANAGFVGMDSFTYTLNDGTGNLAVGTVNVTVNAPLVSTVGLNLNGTVFNSTTNKTMILNASTVASNPVTRADVYVALQLPDGTLLAMQPDGSFSTTLTPLLSNIAVPDFTGPIFNFSFTGAEPVGNYTWFAALTMPGTLNTIGALVTAPFSFAP